MSDTNRSWLKLSMDVRPPVKKRLGDRLRWDGTLVLTATISGSEFNVPIANCRAEVDLRPPPLGREVLLHLLRSAIADSTSPIPDAVRSGMLALRDHLGELPASTRTPSRKGRTRPARKRRRAL